jgi:glycerol-3-phosphate dehydrogenase
VPDASYEALASRYGHAAHDVLALAAERGELAQPIVAGLPDLLAEVALAARREQARSIGDALLRRTRLGLLAARELTGRELNSSSHGAAGVGAQGGPVERVGTVLGRELGWSAERLAAEVDRFASEAAAEGMLLAGDAVESVSPLGSPLPRARS